MGNAGCSTAQQVVDMKDPELAALHAADEACITLLQQQFPGTEICKTPGLDQYQVGSGGSAPKESLKPQATELGVMCEVGRDRKVSQLYDDMLSAMMGEIRYLRETETSPAGKFSNSQQQAICRVYDALLREEEREKRRVVVKIKEQLKEKKEKSILPPIGKVGLDFGVSVLISIIETFGEEKPGLVRKVLDIASRVVGDLEPMSLSGYGDAVSEPITAVITLLTRVINGEFPGLDKADELKTLTALMGLALATGSLTGCLSLTEKLIHFPESEDWSEILPVLTPLLSKLYGLMPAGKSKLTWTWNTGKVGPDIVISNEEKTITRTNSSAWGNNLSEQTVTSGIHYIEFHIDRNSSSCLLIGVAPPSFSDWGSKCSTGEVISWQADGDSYVGGSGKGNIGAYTANDKVGMLLNMEEHCLTFYKNGEKKGSAIYGVPEEVAVIICFGGSDQFVTITDEPEIPSDIQSVIQPVKKAAVENEEEEEEIVFRKSGDEIIKDPMFKLFTKGEGTGKETPVIAALFILASLEIQGERLFGNFELDKVKVSYAAKLKFGRSVGLSVDVQGATFKFLMDVLEFLIGIYQQKAWETVSFKYATWASLCVLRMLRNHIFASKTLNLTESESGLAPDKIQSIRNSLDYLSKLNLSVLELESTPENVEAAEALSQAAASASIHGFELYYPTLNSQLEFVLEGLLSGSGSGNQRIVDSVMKKISLPLNLIQALDMTQEETRNRANKFLTVLLEKTTNESLAYINGEGSLSDNLMSSFFIAQNVFLTKIAKAEMNDDVKEMATNFIFGFLQSIQTLLDAAIERTKGKLTDETEAILKKTLLGSHTTCFLRTLSVLPLDTSTSSRLLRSLALLIPRLNQIQGGKPEKVKGLALVSEVYESEHPYPNNADQPHSYEVPNAVEYILEFDSRCRSENNYDYLELFKEAALSTSVKKWTGTGTWADQPVTIQQPGLFFKFHSDGSNNDWGFRVVITAKIPVDITKESYIDEIRNCASRLMVSVCRGLVVGNWTIDDNIKSIFANELIKTGVKDTALMKLLPQPPELDVSINELAEITQTAILPLATDIPQKYCGIPIIDELIEGSERTIATFTSLKAQAFKAEEKITLGGEEMDQAERALFGLFLAYFELSMTFESLLQTPQEIGDMLKLIIQQVCRIRTWAQQKINAGTKSSFSDIAQDIVNKTILLLNTDYRTALVTVGVDKILAGLTSLVKKSASADMEGGKSMLRFGAKILGKTMKTNPGVKKAQTLMKLRKTKNESTDTVQKDEEKVQFRTIYNLVLNVFESPLTATAICEESLKRRNRAASRTIGLNVFSMNLPSTLQSEMVGIICSAFINAFAKGTGKTHYTEGVSGTDPLVIDTMRNAFFVLYQKLFDLFNLQSISDVDCTNHSNFQNLLQLIEALAFPLDESDANRVREMRMRASMHLAISWMKGIDIKQKIPAFFDRSKCVMALAVEDEEGYEKGDHYVLSCHPVNRIQGEGNPEDIEGQEHKVIEVRTGAADSTELPICDVLVLPTGDDLEGYERVDGNVNEIGDSLSLFIKREVPREEGKYLRKVVCTGWNPVLFDFQYEPYSYFATVETNEDDQRSRKLHSDLMRHSAWLLFKLLTYINTQPDTQSAVSTSKLETLERLAAMIFGELTWAPCATDSDQSLGVRKAVSGKVWRNADPLVQLPKNPMVEWIEKIRLDANEYLALQKEGGVVPNTYEVSFLDAVNDYIANTDPFLQGVLDNPPEGYCNVPANCRNSEGKIDFFCFLNATVQQAETILSPFWNQNVQSSPLYQNIPKDMQEATEFAGEISVDAILNAFYQTIQQNLSNSFLTFLGLFRSSEPQGIVTGKSIPENTPPDFLNSKGELDFFTAVNAIRTKSQAFYSYFQEIKAALAVFPELPSSCREYYSQRQGSAMAEYQGSLMLLLYQCCKSKGMQQAVAKPMLLLELMKHMFMGTLKNMTFAFRIMRDVLTSQLDPVSITPLWNSLPKRKIRAELGAEACRGFIPIILQYVGMRTLIHTRSFKYIYTSLERIERSGCEALVFLLRLSKKDRWREYLIQTCLDLLQNVGENSGTSQTILIGALEYLRSLKGELNLGIKELNIVKLVGAGIPEGLLIKYVPTEPTAVVFSQETGKLRKEKREAVVNSVIRGTSFLAQSLSADQASGLFSALSRVYVHLETTGLTSMDKSAESVFANMACTRSAQLLILEVLKGLIDSSHTFPKETAPDLISTLMKSMKSQIGAVSTQSYHLLQKYLFTRHQTKLKNWMKVASAESRFSNTVKEPEEVKLMSTYSAEQRYFVTLLKSFGMGFGVIKEMIDANVGSLEEVLRLVDVRIKNKRKEKAAKSGSSDALLIYKLTKNEKNLAVYSGPPEKINYRETSSGQLAFSTKEAPSQPAFLLKQLEDTMFEKAESAPDELTIILAIGFLGNPEASTFGFVMGNIKLRHEITQTMVVQGDVMKNSSFRIFLSYTGAYKIVTDPGGQVVLEGDNGFGFEDISQVKFGLFLETKGKVALKGLIIYQGHYTSAAKNLFEEEGDEEEVLRGRLINYSLKPPTNTYLALNGVLGVPHKLANQMALASTDLKQVLNQFYSEPVELLDFATNYGTVVQDCVFVRKLGDVPEGYTPISMYVEGEYLSDYGFYSGIVVAITTTTVRSKGYISSIEWRNDAFVATKDNEGKDAPLTGIYLIKTTSPKQITLPPGYTLVTVGSKVVSLTNDPHVYYFLATCNVSSVRSLPFNDLTAMSKEISDGGMVDYFPETSASEEMTQVEIDAELKKLAALSGVQLHTRFSQIEKTYISQKSFQLVIKLLNKWQEMDINPEMFSQLLEHSGSNLEELGQAIVSLLQQPQFLPVISQALLLDVLAQLCTACTQSTGSEVSKRTLTYESTHPYANSLDLRETISVPGAYRMVFTFVPECKSENNYDYLQFAKDEGASEVLYKHTGSTWPNFEFEGSTVYTLFHSDGSNNDWGYKYTVEAYIRVAGASFFGAKRAIWLLESIFFTEPKLAAFMPNFLGKELINALTMFAHCTSEPALSLRALAILKKMLQLSTENPTNSKGIVDIVASEVIALYTEEEKKPKKSDFLKASISFTTELKEKYEFAMDAEWFNHFFDNFCFLRGFVKKDEHFQYMLLKQFLESRGKSLDESRESSHPYLNNAFSTNKVYIRGANVIDVVLTPESETRPQDCILFSLDPACTQPIVPKAQLALSNISWNQSIKGPDILITNEGKTVTRTNSSAWGNAIFDQVFRDGRARIKIKINNDGGSTCLYIGVVEEKETYNLTGCVSKDYPDKSWVYHLSGDVQKRGYSVGAPKYATNDELTIELDFDEHNVTFFKNDQQVYQFDDLDVPVTGIACFGGSNQVISIISIESEAGFSAGHTFTVPGETFYYHFPVHIGYLDMISNKWNKVSNSSLTYSRNGKTVIRSAGDTSQLTIYTTNMLRAERNLVEFKISDLGADTTLSLGMGVTGSDSLLLSYSNKGTLQKLTESVEMEGFKAGDSIAILFYLNISEFRIYKNGAQVSGIIRIPLEAGKEHRWGISFNGEARIDILEVSQIAATFDLIGKNIAPGRTPFNKYGYKFTATPTYIGRNKQYVFESLGPLEGDWQRHYANQKSLFSPEVCEELVTYLDESSLAQDKDPATLQPEDITLQPQELVRFGLLRKLTGDEVRTIFSLLRDLNLKAVSMLPLLSLDLAENPELWSESQATFVFLRRYLFLKRKQALIAEILEKSKTTERPPLVIDKSLAERARESGEPDHVGSASYFGQTCKTFRESPNRIFRNEERFFQPNLGEGQLDTPEAYNGVIDMICDELQSSFLPLLIPSSNAVNSLGPYRDAWLPNPAADSTLQMSMFEFLGKLFGVAIRTKRPLKLVLSPIFWKRLQLTSLKMQDLKDFDEGVYQTLDLLRHLEDHEIDEKTFSITYGNETFTTVDSGARTIELVPGGSSVALSYQNCPQYVELLQQQRLRECAAVYRAIRRGMSAVIPVHLFYLFTWKEAEGLVTSGKGFDPDRLREKTVYDGYSNSTPVVGYLWDTLRECKPSDRALFLQFVWARSSLPKTLVQKFNVVKKEVEGNANDQPLTSVAGTFTLYLPEYSSLEVFKTRFMTAILSSQPSDLESLRDSEAISSS